MAETTDVQCVLVVVSGADSVGVTSELTSVVARNHAHLLDIEQVVLSGQLTLCLLLGVEPEATEGDAVLKDLLFAAKRRGMELRFQALETRCISAPPVAEEPKRYAITAIGDVVDAAGVSALTSVLAEHGANIESIRRLSHDRLSSLEAIATVERGHEKAEALRGALAAALQEHGLDVAVQRERLTRRSKRLIVMDMDSTLIQIECIDELARMHGVVDRVAGITERAMAGELDFEESLRERVGLLEGMAWDKALTLAQNLPVTPGAREMLSVLRTLGFKTAVISGGFTFAANTLKEELGLDYAYANELEVVDGVLTGRVVGPIVTPERKAKLLTEIAEREGIAPEQTIAVGDGANDLTMLQRAGLGIAFHAKAKLKAHADTSVSRGGLDRILYLLGLHARDVREALAEQ